MPQTDGLRAVQSVLGAAQVGGCPQGPAGGRAARLQARHAPHLRAAAPVARRLPLRHVGALQLPDPRPHRRRRGQPQHARLRVSPNVNWN